MPPPLRRRSGSPRPPAAPSVPRREQLQTPRSELEPDGLWDGVWATAEDTPSPAEGAVRMGGSEIRESVLQGIRLSSARADSLRLTDVEVRGCDLSGMVADGATVTRVRFVGCRLTGMVLSDARLTDVSFEDCHADMINLRMARVHRVRLSSTRCRQADLLEARVADLSTDGADLRGATLHNATFTAADLRGADLEDVRGPSALRGSLISPEQVLGVGLALIAEAGIRVE
ncbi:MULTISPECIES: pentapeptide repeat-containing protein [unclassified Dietzia]|uniref:pentapeptide repeat-containing protein n=1 Tax=unclassified Dietzia TaxID=2617939 RepID=UPI0028169212|nr:pentapeptide repeat-containing protein [Dietzia sp. DQ12-76]